MRVLFAGTPEIALPSLRVLAEHCQLVGVLTRGDRPEGRRRVLSPPPVKKLALDLGLPVLQPEKLDAQAMEAVRRLGVDLMVVFAYGKIFRPNFLALFPQGAINLHPSALPAHRGPSPLAAAILAGDRHYGITVQRVALKMDAGDILDQRIFPLSEQEDCGSLSAKVSAQAPTQLLSVLQHWQELKPRAQCDELASYCSLVRKEDGCIDWRRPAACIARQVRAYHPWPGSYTFAKLAGRRERWLIKQARVCPANVTADLPAERQAGRMLGFHPDWGLLCQTGDGVLGAQRLQRQGRRELAAAEFVCGLTQGVESVMFENGVGD